MQRCGIIEDYLIDLRLFLCISVSLCYKRLPEQSPIYKFAGILNLTINGVSRYAIVEPGRDEVEEAETGKLKLIAGS